MAATKGKTKGGKAAIAAAERRLMRVIERSTIEIDAAVNSAQLVAFDAMEATGAERLTLVGKALEQSPLCVDAWGILASEAPEGSGFALELWRQAVAAGEVMLGPWRMEEYKGEFWGWVETRPYMRARQGLAMELRRQGQMAEAIDTLRGSLALNPNDNQGIRYILLDWLLEAGADAEAKALHEAYAEDDSAAWHYAAALLAFRQSGDGPAAAAALQAALANNPHVPGLLLGRVAAPEEEPEYYSPGDPSEAVVYLETAAAGWKAAPGALDWLARAVPDEVAASPPKRGRKPRATA
jgi:tetratricopeptide (TPR) repeat protein